MIYMIIGSAIMFIPPILCLLFFWQFTGLVINSLIGKSLDFLDSVERFIIVCPVQYAVFNLVSIMYLYGFYR